MAKKSTTWIISIANSDCDGVTMLRFEGTELGVRKKLVKLLKEDKREGGRFDYGDETPEDVREEYGTLNAYATYSDYHIDYTAQKLEEIPEA